MPTEKKKQPGQRSNREEQKYRYGETSTWKMCGDMGRGFA